MVFCNGCGYDQEARTCKRCAEVEWKKCTTCPKTTPFPGKCLHCRDRRDRRDQRTPRDPQACEICDQMTTDGRFCHACFNTPQKCASCGGRRRPGNEYCRRCSETADADWGACTVCQEPTTKNKCGSCFGAAREAEHKAFKARQARRERRAYAESQPERPCRGENCEGTTKRGDFCRECYQAMGHYIFRRQ